MTNREMSPGAPDTRENEKLTDKTLELVIQADENLGHYLSKLYSLSKNDTYDTIEDFVNAVLVVENARTGQALRAKYQLPPDASDEKLAEVIEACKRMADCVKHGLPPNASDEKLAEAVEARRRMVSCVKLGLSTDTPTDVLEDTIRARRAAGDVVRFLHDAEAERDHCDALLERINLGLPQDAPESEYEIAKHDRDKALERVDIGLPPDATTDEVVERLREIECARLGLPIDTPMKDLAATQRRLHEAVERAKLGLPTDAPAEDLAAAKEAIEELSRKYRTPAPDPDIQSYIDATHA